MNILQNKGNVFPKEKAVKRIFSIDEVDELINDLRLKRRKVNGSPNL